MKLIEISPIKVQTIQSVDQANMVDNDRKTMENNGKQWKTMENNGPAANKATQ